jgi:sodium-independent sulfate anion transporter 11
METILHMNENDHRPLLRAVVYDFGAVSNIDSTGIQSLVDTRQQLDKYADREVEYHFAAVMSPWIKRALVAGGFGTGHPAHRVVEVASVVPISTVEDPDTHGEEEFQRRRRKSIGARDVENGDLIEQIPDKHATNFTARTTSSDSDVLPIVPTNYPFFHLDLDDAVKSAEKVPIL